MRIPPEIWVLRHGETEWNAEGRLQGRLDSPLTTRGLAQARAQGEILRAALPQHKVRVLASPSPRAWRTAQIACVGHDPVPDPRLVEIGLGQWQGQTLNEVFARHPDLDHETDPHLWKFHAPGGESLTQMEARVADLLASLDGPTVLVTHGLTSRVLRCLVLAMPLTAMAELPGGQGVVHHLKDGVARVLKASGDTAHRQQGPG